MLLKNKRHSISMISWLFHVSEITIILYSYVTLHNIRTINELNIFKLRLKKFQYMR